MAGFRPLLWHLAHIGVYQNYWVLQRCAGQPSINTQYDTHFDPIKTPREEAKVLPTRAEIEAYLHETLDRVERFLEDDDARPANDTLSKDTALELVIEHELQHQETIAFVLQSMPLQAKRPGPAVPRGKRAAAQAEILLPRMRVTIGGTGHGFVYDNEVPAHDVELPAFAIDRDLITNAEFAAFVDHGGYERREWWSDEGWRWKTESGVAAPLYWAGSPRRERCFFEDLPLRNDAPVTGISWFEADAYARSCGKRLPSEAEWEAAAGWDPSLGRMRRFVWGDVAKEPGSRSEVSWATTAVGTDAEGTSALGMHDALGNLWQWTSSEFRGYPGFVAYPYPEYSQAWFDGDHFVARGGSWFTDPALGRVSFRNFYRRRFRQAFIGIRCARDAR